MKKVLIIGPTFFHYNESISSAFKQVGYTTTIVSYDEPIHPFTPWNAFIHKFSFHKERLKEKSRREFNQFITKEFTSFAPDLVFIYNGDILELATISHFKDSSKVAIWMLDGIYRHPQSEALAPWVDAYFCFEQNDAELLQQKGINAHFLPQACDPSIYFPLDLKKDIDILFVGTLYKYPNRIKLLKKLVERFPDHKIEIYGIYKPFYKNPFKWLFREQRGIFKNRNISPAEVNKLYNRAKINLNIHHEQSRTGANPKVFEIAGAGAFQLVDRNPYIESLFTQQEVGMFSSTEELLSQIETCLSTDISGRASNGYNIIRTGHTFVDRIREVLTIIQL